jgi:hypothetical protein
MTNEKKKKAIEGLEFREIKFLMPFPFIPSR